MEIFQNFSSLFIEVWKQGILGVDIFQILIGLGIFLIFLLFRSFISKVIIRRLENMAKRTTNKLDDTFVEAMRGTCSIFTNCYWFFYCKLLFRVQSGVTNIY